MDFFRAKQAGVSADFTATLANAPDVFILDEVAKYGFNSTISALFYDPTQSLLAVGTHEHGGISGEVHVFGQKRVHVKFTLTRKATVKTVRLCDSHLIVLDSKNELTIFNMSEPKARPVGYSPPGIVTVLETDPCLDWVFMGLQSGEIVIYDIDREVMAPFRIPNYWRERSPKARLLPVTSLQLHPKDVGTLLIGYLEGAVVYSFKQNAPLHYLQFELPPGALGSDTELAQIRTTRRPRLSQAIWHPTGTFICTTYEDAVMVFWNPKDGSIVQARTIQDAYVHLPGNLPAQMLDGGESISIRQPIFKIAWCSTNNPDDTSLLLAGGNSMTMPAKGMTLLDFGSTPNTITSSVQALGEHLANPRRQRVLPTPTQLDVVDFCLIPRVSPHYGSTHDPVAIIGLYASGELVTLRFPDGAPLSPSNILHPSLSLAHPFPTRVDVSAVNRQRWLGMEESRKKGPEFVIGGVERRHVLRRYENRTIGLSCHPNGFVRIWDLGHDDEIENQGCLELDLCRVLQRGIDLEVKSASMSAGSGETAVAMKTGGVVVFRWARNKAFGRPSQDEEHATQSQTGGEVGEGLVDVRARVDPELKEGLLPYTMLDQNCGPIAAVKMSDVGFLGVAYESGYLTVVDLRGPAIIFHQNLSELTKEQRRLSIRKPRESVTEGVEKATCLEFGVMTLDGEEFSCLALFVGTSTGRVITYKILPQGPIYTCALSGSTTLDAQVLTLTPLNSTTGTRAWATPQAFAALRDGIKTPGILVAVTPTAAHIFRPAAARGAHRSFDKETPCITACVTELDEYGICLTALISPGHLKAYTLPGLKSLPVSLNLTHLRAPVILESGHILGWSGEHELMLNYIFGRGAVLDDPKVPADILYNPNTPPPPRPTISNLQWLAGTQYISTTDLDLLIGGPDRPMSAKQQMQMRQEAAEARQQNRAGSSAAAAGAGGGVFANMGKALQERTEALSFAGDSMDKLGESSAKFADDVDKFVKEQKRKMLWGGVMGKLF
ncbi:hypothetical protein EX30DRAFT_359209 [Ascodesmis nigricans]|uniref:Lethal giant larvae (Lgl)-like C-terminal domain-containing protein n=1 Tax=Ascodesmis nigricans TaxID=341454 RepID=A0A4S2MUF4_9PEZI|nr:hypothetical protein EX30DRAFT_359209 [Ascodesmis nigricans]